MVERKGSDVTIFMAAAQTPTEQLITQGAVSNRNRVIALNWGLSCTRFTLFSVYILCNGFFVRPSIQN